MTPTAIVTSLISEWRRSHARPSARSWRTVPPAPAESCRARLPRWPEDTGQGEQQQHGDPECPGAHRERQDGRQAEQPASGRWSSQLAADDLPGDQPAVRPVQVGGVHEPGDAGDRGSVAQGRANPGGEGREVDQRQPVGVHQDRPGQGRDDGCSRSVHRDHEPPPVDAVDDDSQPGAHQPRQALYRGDGRDGCRRAGELSREQRESHQPHAVTENSQEVRQPVARERRPDPGVVPTLPAGAIRYRHLLSGRLLMARTASRSPPRRGLGLPGGYLPERLGEERVPLLAAAQARQDRTRGLRQGVDLDLAALVFMCRPASLLGQPRQFQRASYVVSTILRTMHVER